MAEKEKNNTKEIPLLEWLTAAVGLILVLGAIGFVIYKAAAGGDQPPVLKVKSVETARNEAGFLVKFTVENEGDMSAADVLVEGKLTGGAAEESETSSVTIDYVPSKSERSGGLYFKKNPQENKLEISVKGYQNP